MNLSAAVETLKRWTGYGTVAVTNDQATEDIVRSINGAEGEAWLFKPWHYSLNEREITTVLAQRDYTLQASDGYIEVIYPQAGGLPLVKFTRKRYLDFQRAESDAEDTGGVFGYIHNGRDSDDKLKLRLVRTPASAGDVFIAWTKKRLTEYAVGDIATNQRMQYFPNEAHEAILVGAEARIRKIQGKKEEMLIARAEFLNRLGDLWKTEGDAPDQQLRADLPDMYRRRRRAYGR